MLDTQRDVQQRMGDMLADAQMEHIHLSYYLTSIYDHSIYEAFSKIIQKLIRELPTLENLLNVLCQVIYIYKKQRSEMEKSKQKKRY